MKEQRPLLIFSILVYVLASLVSIVYALPIVLFSALSLYFFVFTSVLNYRLSKALAHTDKNKFTFAFLGMTAINMALCLAWIVVSILALHCSKLVAGVSVLGYYFAYTGFFILIWKKKLLAHKHGGTPSKEEKTS
jgi:hypothetical protein